MWSLGLGLHVSHSLTNRVWSIRGLTPSQKIVLLCYAAHHNHKHAETICWPKRETVIDETGLSRASFYRQRAALIDDGYLSPVPVNHPVIAAHAEALWQSQGWRLSVDEAWLIVTEPNLKMGLVQSQIETDSSQNGIAYKERTVTEPELEPEVYPSVTETVAQTPLAFEPEQPERERAEPAFSRSKKFQKFWGATEGQIRRNVAPEVFDRAFSGIEILDMRHDSIILRAPPWICAYHGGADGLAVRLEPITEESGLRRGRRLEIVTTEERETYDAPN